MIPAGCGKVPTFPDFRPGTGRFRNSGIFGTVWNLQARRGFRSYQGERLQDAACQARGAEPSLPAVSGKRTNFQPAFSLIESLVVMGIIVLLATILIAGLRSTGDDEPKLPVPVVPEKENRVGTPPDSGSGAPESPVLPTE